MKCSYFQNSLCRSCKLLDLSYDETLILKKEKLKNFLPEYAHQDNKTFGLEEKTTGSRFKAKLAVFRDESDQNSQFGFYNKDGSVVNIENCPLHTQGLNELLPQIKMLLGKYKIPPYDIKNKSGELKYLLISKSMKGDQAEFLVRFVLRSRESLDRLKKAAGELITLSISIKVVTANIQPIHQAILEGDEEVLLTSDKMITHQFDEFRLSQGTRSFFQVTPIIAMKLYNSLSQKIKHDKPTSLIDLYCGVGAFSFYASRFCPDVTGVEISSDAIEFAKDSNIFNKTNITFLNMDVEVYLKTNHKYFEAVLVNPPRRGLNDSILKSLIEMNSKFIYYSSCNAETMARDFEVLKKHYQIKNLELFDMFPYTSHFETLMCLERLIP